MQPFRHAALTTWAFRALSFRSACSQQRSHFAPAGFCKADMEKHRLWPRQLHSTTLTSLRPCGHPLTSGSLVLPYADLPVQLCTAFYSDLPANDRSFFPMCHQQPVHHHDLFVLIFMWYPPHSPGSILPAQTPDPFPKPFTMCPMLTAFVQPQGPW